MEELIPPLYLLILSNNHLSWYKQGKPTGTIAGKVISINKPEMTITVQNPTQGMEIKVTAVQMKKINVGDRVEVRYILKEGKAYAISIRKLPGMPN